MLNSISYTLTTDAGERFLTIHPVLLQSDFDGALNPTEKYLIYERIVPLDKMSDNELAAHFDWKASEEYNPSDDEIYLGCYSYDTDNGMTWKWEGKAPGFTEEEFNTLAEVILNNDEIDLENDVAFNHEGYLFSGPAMPKADDGFTIFLTVNDKLEPFQVFKWGDKFEVQLVNSYYLLSVDENGNWIEDHIRFQPLPAALKADIIRQIEAHYKEN